jgi:hypothetical protein
VHADLVDDETRGVHRVRAAAGQVGALERVHLPQQRRSVATQVEFEMIAVRLVQLVSRLGAIASVCVSLLQGIKICNQFFTL